MKRVFSFVYSGYVVMKAYDIKEPNTTANACCYQIRAQPELAERSRAKKCRDKRTNKRTNVYVTETQRFCFQINAYSFFNIAQKKNEFNCQYNNNNIHNYLHRHNNNQQHDEQRKAKARVNEDCRRRRRQQHSVMQLILFCCCTQFSIFGRFSTINSYFTRLHSTSL